MEKLIYENPLSSEKDIKNWTLEGKAKISFMNHKMQMENELSAVEGQKANYVLWCDRIFPSDIIITWKFRPIKEPGLAMTFFAAKGIRGTDIFDESCAPRNGEYKNYHHGDINAFHVSYFRRKEPDERAFHTCNLRKSYGFHLVAQGADPIPDVCDSANYYEIKIVKNKDTIQFFINDLKTFEFKDDGKTYGARLESGRIGFRQLAPMIGEYSDLKVYEIC